MPSTGLHTSCAAGAKTLDSIPRSGVRRMGISGIGQCMRNTFPESCLCPAAGLRSTLWANNTEHDIPPHAGRRLPSVLSPVHHQRSANPILPARRPLVNSLCCVMVEPKFDAVGVQPPDTSQRVTYRFRHTVSHPPPSHQTPLVACIVGIPCPLPVCAASAAGTRIYSIDFLVSSRVTTTDGAHGAPAALPRRMVGHGRV